MKRIISILLLALLLFNWFGYRLLVSVMEMNANTQLETQLDENNYDESELISIKIPVSYLPYYNNSKSFERVDGQVEIQGVPYKYVKRRTYNDTLEMLCIPNHTALKLQTAKNEFFKFTNDVKQGKRSESRSGSYKSFSIDCFTVNDLTRVTETYFILSIISPQPSTALPFSYTLTAEQPPEHFFIA